MNDALKKEFLEKFGRGYKKYLIGLDVKSEDVFAWFEANMGKMSHAAMQERIEEQREEIKKLRVLLVRIHENLIALNNYFDEKLNYDVERKYLLTSLAEIEIGMGWK